MTGLCFLRIAAAYAIAAVPGYSLGRICSARNAWLTALPIGMMVILLGVELADAIALPLRFSTILAWELAVGAIAGWVNFRFSPARFALKPEPDSARTWIQPQRLLLLLLLALIGYFAVERAVMVPLLGTDTPFRWNFLAAQMLKQQRLNFYPPVTAADFRVYFFPDGFPPLISASYWWIYAAAGRPVQWALGPLVAGQYIVALFLVFRLGAVLHGKTAGWAAVAVLAATPLYFSSVLIGQENGIIALATIASVLVLYDSTPDEVVRSAILAGALAGAAGSAREYAPVFALCGLFVIASRRMGWRAVRAYAVCAAVLMMPWLIRCWIRDGNPLYPHPFGRLTGNPVYVSLMKSYQAAFGLQNYTLGEVWTLVREIAIKAGMAVAFGLPAVIIFARRSPFLIGGSVLTILIWLASVGFTSGGGAYSLRVLTPLWAFWAVAAGVLVAEIVDPSVKRLAASVVMSAGVLYGLIWAVVYPGEPRWQRLSLRTFVDRNVSHLVVTETGIDQALPSVLPIGTRVLSENAYVHSVLASTGAYEVVPIWSPEVAFLFDPSLSAIEQRRRLLEHRITAVFFYPDAGNTQFCIAHSRFYRSDRRNWKVLGVYRNTLYICELPPVPDSAMP